MLFSGGIGIPESPLMDTHIKCLVIIITVLAFMTLNHENSTRNGNVIIFDFENHISA